jgi:hypothetical protein
LFGDANGRNARATMIRQALERRYWNRAFIEPQDRDSAGLHQEKTPPRPSDCVVPQTTEGSFQPVGWPMPGAM